MIMNFKNFGRKQMGRVAGIFAVTNDVFSELEFLFDPYSGSRLWDLISLVVNLEKYSSPSFFSVRLVGGCNG